MDATRSRASVEQFVTMLEFMERYGDLARPQQGAQGRVRSDRLWQELANLLNSMGGGVQKSIDKWKKVWADWKTKTKKKALHIRHHANTTGGGPNSRRSLTSYEERVVAILGLPAIEGQAEIAEHGLNRPSQSIPSHNIPLPNSVPPLPAINLHLEDHVYASAPTQSPPPPSPSPSPPPPPPPPPVEIPPSLPAPTPLPSTSRQQPPAAPSPHSSASSPRRRPPLRARRRRAQTPFDRAVSEFVAVEQRRLQFEELRERQLHARETQLIGVLERLTDIAQMWMERSTSRGNE